MRKSITTLTALILAFALSGCAGQGLIQAKPERAKDFTVALLQGGETSLSDYAGKPLIIIFGATWCSHCLHEMPIMKKACERRKGGVQFLPIFVKSNKKDALALVSKSGMTCKIGWDPDGKVAAIYGVTGMPETMFINSRGEIVDDYFGTIEQSDIDKGVEKLLKSDEQPQ
jgi:cytochrome c biogenesis protein CcmG, thiol:disulfide interchange protein DsbE